MSASGASGGATSVRDGAAPPQGTRDHPDTPSQRQERKTQVLTHGSAAAVQSIAAAVVIKRGEPFFLCPPDGQIDTSGRHGFGLYHHDMRYLSGYEIRVSGSVPDSLAATAVDGGEGLLELTNEALDLDGATLPKHGLGIRLDRRIEDDPPTLVDHIELRDYTATGADLRLRLTFAADFQDIFSIRGLLRERPGTLEDPHWDGDKLVFGYHGADDVDRTLTIDFDRSPASRDGTSAEFDVNVPARESASLELRLTIEERPLDGAKPLEGRAGKAANASDQGWDATCRADALAFDSAMGRSFTDLTTLRGELEGLRYYAAGVPWFSTLFGRDSIISALQTLAFDRDVAAGTLRLLASRQGTKRDDWRDEEPGKILHELRVGELARLGEIPHTPYYGSVDSTPLFLILLARHAEWAGSLDLFRELRSNVDRALGWIDDFGQAVGDGYVAYDSATKRGLVNQGWKDSGDAIVDADGSLAEPPIALAEVQGYVYAAKMGIAGLFERDGDDQRAAELRRQANDLRDRFERDFWSDELGCYVLALARDRRPCAVVSSNAGQVLWSGIASVEHARAVAERLQRPDMWAGWGIRTLSADATAYNPVGYHLGTVWPHDNGLIADGFRRYGLDADAERVLTALLRASEDFPQQRLPECFSGFDRETFGIPVRYPIACHPQAWAAGALPHLVTSVLGLRPEAFDHRLRIVRPRLPSFLDRLELDGLRVGDASVDLVFERATDGGDDGSGDITAVRPARIEGELDVQVEP